MSVACSTQAIAAVVAPLFAGQVADRWFPAERCVTVLTVVAAGLLWLLSTLTSPAAVIVATQAFWLVMVPSLTLGTALAFAHLGAARALRPNTALGHGRMGDAWLMLGLWFSNPEWLHGNRLAA
jgi:sugar phosphate permease